MTEKQFKDLLETLKIGLNKSNVEIKELLDAKLNEYLDRQDERAGQMQSDIQDALDYVEELIDKMGGGIALAPDELEEAEDTEEINRELLSQATGSNKKAAAFTASADAGGQAGTNVEGTGTSAGGVNPKGKPWFYSINGDKNVDDMFELAEGDLRSGDFFHASSVFDAILKIEMTNAGAYMGKVLSTYQLAEPKEIGSCYNKGLDSSNDLRRASDCGNEKQKKYIKDVMEERRNSELYLDAERVLNQGTTVPNLQQAASQFTALGSYRDSVARADWCHKKIEEIRKAEEERKKERERQERERKIREEERRKEEEKRIEEERKREEKKRRERERKQRIKKIAGIAIVAGIVFVAGFFFYSRYMTSTYYGTDFYLGKNFNYDEYTIADSVIEIAPYTFEGMAIKSIIIPESVETIGEGAFIDCVELQNINIPSSVKSIGDGAFTRCTSLQNVTFSEGLESIGEYAFSDCTALTEIKFPTSLSEIGMGALKDCYFLKEARFEKVSKVGFGDDVFESCARLETLVLPDASSSYIPNSIISNCCNLNFEELAVEGYYFDRSTLYEYAIDGVPLMANETQFMNAIWGKTFEEHALKTQTQISDNGVISNIQIGEEIEDSNGRYVEFSFDYQEDIRLMHLLGTINENGVTITCDSTDVDRNLLLVQGEDGNYPLMQKILAGKEFKAKAGSFIFEEEEFFFKQVNIKETAHEITGETIYEVTFQFDANKQIGTLAVDGCMKMDGVDIANAEIVTNSLQCTEFNIAGTYENSMEVIQIADEDYLIFIPGADFDTIYYHPSSWMGGEATLEWHGGEGTTIAIDWNEDGINLDAYYSPNKRTYVKVSDEIPDISQYDSKLAGVWTGTYADGDTIKEMTKYIIPVKEDLYVSVFDYGRFRNDEFRVMEMLYYDASDQSVRFVGLDMLHVPYSIHPFSIKMVDLAGAVNEDGTEIIGEESCVFKLTKTADLEDLSNIL